MAVRSIFKKIAKQKQFREEVKEILKMKKKNGGGVFDPKIRKWSPMTD